MILTVTLNSALDRILFISEFQPGTTMRPSKMIESVGGKGFDTSVVLQTLTAENIALGLVAGLTGQQLANLLDRYGITHDLIWVDGETRIAHVVIETRHHRHSHLIAAGLSVSSAAYGQLLSRFELLLNKADWVVAGGTIAAGIPVSCYRRMTELVQAQGVSILLDSFGQPLLEALAARPSIVKMNQEEFSQTFAVRAGSLDDLSSAAQAIYQQHALPALIITCGSAGILACTPEGSYLVSVPPQPAINAAGAGDAVSAALVWRRSRGDGWPEALRWAAATGAAVVLTEGTADCRWEDIKFLLANTDMIKW
jgi:1-phosphofructokinase family hexose kinase